MDTSAIFALGAALSWCLAGMFGHKPAVALGSLHFNRIRMVVSALMLLAYCIVFGVTINLNATDAWLILASGLIGAAGGDFFLFSTMRRLGPRRTGILFAANAPIAAALGWFFLSEVLSAKDITAIVIGFLGIILAVIYGKRRDLAHIWEDVTPPMWIGIVFGLLAALGQAIGVLLMQPVIEGGMNPVAGALLRTGVAAIAFWAAFPIEKLKGIGIKKLLPDPSLYLSILGNGFFGMALGMALLLKALETGTVGAVSLLSATSPLMLLPFVWAKTRMSPTLGAWIGAVLVVLCSWMLAQENLTITLDVFALPEYFALITFVILICITPGPANMLAMTAGAKFGLRHCILFIIGMAAGMLMLNLAMGFGLYTVLERHPVILEVLKYISAVYVFYLCYRMARTPFGKINDAANNSAKFVASGGISPRLPSFAEGFIINPLNPKAWAMLTVVWFGFGPAIEGVWWWRVVVISTAFLVVQLLGYSAWCYGGDKLIGMVKTATAKTFIQQSLALLTALVVLWAVFL